MEDRLDEPEYSSEDEGRTLASAPVVNRRKHRAVAIRRSTLLRDCGPGGLVRGDPAGHPRKACICSPR